MFRISWNVYPFWTATVVMAEESTTKLALPAPGDIKNDETTTLELNSTIKLDKLGVSGLLIAL